MASKKNNLSEEERKVLMSVASRDIDEIRRGQQLNARLSIVLIVVMIVFLGFMSYVFYVIDKNDFLSKIIYLVERMIE